MARPVAGDPPGSGMTRGVRAAGRRRPAWRRCGMARRGRPGLADAGAGWRGGGAGGGPAREGRPPRPAAGAGAGAARRSGRRSAVRRRTGRLGPCPATLGPARPDARRSRAVAAAPAAGRGAGRWPAAASPRRRVADHRSSRAAVAGPGGSLRCRAHRAGRSARRRPPSRGPEPRRPLRGRPAGRGLPLGHESVPLTDRPAGPPAPPIRGTDPVPCSARSESPRRAAHARAGPGRSGPAPRPRTGRPARRAPDRRPSRCGRVARRRTPHPRPAAWRPRPSPG